MTTLREQRMITTHKLGRRDAQEQKPAIPVVGWTEEETQSYLAGYQGEKKRLAAGDKDRE